MRHRAAGKPESPAASMARLSVVFAAGGSGLPVGAQKERPKTKKGVVASFLWFSRRGVQGCGGRKRAPQNKKVEMI